MFQKVKFLLVSTTVLTLSTLSVQAMNEQDSFAETMNEPDSFAETRARLRRTGKSERSDLYVKNPKALNSSESTLPLGIPEDFVNTTYYSHSESSTQEESYTTDDEFNHCESSSHDDSSESTKENQHTLNNFEVNSQEFQNVIKACNKNFDANKENLVEYFEHIPQDHKIPALKYFMSESSYRVRVDNFKYTPKGEVVETPSKLTGMIPLRDKLTGLPNQSEPIDQNNDSVLSDYIDELEHYQIELALALSYRDQNSSQPKEICEKIY